MRKYIRLLDHSIDGATNLTLDSGRFNGSVSLTIGGTPGTMTVNAAELLAALQEIMESWCHKPFRDADDPPKNVSRPTRKRISNRSENKSFRRQLRKTTQAQFPIVVRNPVAASPPSLPQTDIRENMPWTEYEDSILDVLTPEFAAEKLHRPLSEIHVRRLELGLDP